MLNGEFKRIDKNRTILSRFYKKNGYDTELRVYSGELYQTMINGEKVYILYPKSSDYSIAEFFSGLAFPFCDFAQKKTIGKKEALKKYKEIIQKNWETYLYIIKVAKLNSLDCETTDKKYLLDLIDEKQNFIENAKTEKEKNDAYFKYTKDIHLIRNFMRGKRK